MCTLIPNNLYGPDGKRHPRTFARLEDAKRYKREMGTARDRGAWIDPKLARVTFGEYVSVASR
jgi:hypothetical protein